MALQNSANLFVFVEIVAPNEASHSNENLSIILTAAASLIVIATIAGVIIAIVIYYLHKKHKGSVTNFSKKREAELLHVSTTLS